MRSLLTLLPAVAVLLAWLPVLSGGAVWDDHTLLLPSVLDAAWGPLPFNPDYFRPLGIWTLRLGAGAADPLHAQHLINLLLHALNTLLVAALIRQRTGRDWEPLVLSLLYGLHPALVEGVAFISSRFDLLMTAGLLLGLTLERRLSGPWRPLCVGGAFLLAALSKEHAAAFPVVLLLWRRAEHASFAAVIREHRATWIALMLAGLLYLGLRHHALGGLLSADRVMIDPGEPLSHLLLIGRSLAGYLGLTLLPMGRLSPIHFTALPVAPDATSVGTLLGVAVLLVGLTRLGPTGWRLLAGSPRCCRCCTSCRWTSPAARPSPSASWSSPPPCSSSGSPSGWHPGWTGGAGRRWWSAWCCGGRRRWSACGRPCRTGAASRPCGSGA